MKIFRQVSGYEGLYEVSKCGIVRSIDREVKDSNGRAMKYKGKVLSPSESSSLGHLGVSLSKGNKVKRFLVHRLVFISFVGDIPSDKEIDHINRNPRNNKVENLRICTRSQNKGNCKKRKQVTKSTKKGIYKTPSNTFCVQVKNTNRGTYKTIEDAIEAHKKASIEEFGEFACC